MGGLAARQGGNGDVGKLVQSRRRQELLRTGFIAGDHGYRLHGRRPWRQARTLGEQDDVGVLRGDLPAAQAPGNAPHQGRLAGTIRAHHGRYGTRGKIRAHPLDGHGQHRRISGTGKGAELIDVHPMQPPGLRLVASPPKGRQARQRQTGQGQPDKQRGEHVRAIRIDLALQINTHRHGAGNPRLRAGKGQGRAKFAQRAREGQSRARSQGRGDGGKGNFAQDLPPAQAHAARRGEDFLVQLAQCRINRDHHKGQRHKGLRHNDPGEGEGEVDA